MAKRKAPRQGDILIVPVRKGSISGKPVAPTNGHYTVAEGEHTGHSHQIKATPHVAMVDNGIDTFLKLDKSEPMRHQEHGAVPISVGESLVVRQRRVMPGSEHMVHIVSD